MDSGQSMGLVGIIVGVLGIVIGAINHRRLRSSCCGRKAEFSIDIENTTPNGARTLPPISSNSQTNQP